MDQRESKRDHTLVCALKLVVAIVMISMVLMIFVNAMLRYIFNTGIAATEELSRYAFVWVSALGAIIAYYQNKHVGVNLLVENLSGIYKLFIQIIADLAVIFAIYLLCRGGFKYFMATYTQDSAALPIPLGIITITPLVMGIAMLPKILLLIKNHIAEYKDYSLKKNDESGAK